MVTNDEGEIADARSLWPPHAYPTALHAPATRRCESCGILSDMKLWIQIGGLFSLSIFLRIVGNLKSTSCDWQLRNNCADAGFSESASAGLIGILAVVLLTVKLLVIIRSRNQSVL